MAKEELVNKIRQRIRKREEIKSSSIYNAFRRVGGTEVSDRSIASAIKELEDKGLIKRSGHGQNTTCEWLGEKVDD